MAAHDPRVRAVAAVSPPYDISIYWNLTLAGMRRELAALYDADEEEMARAAERMTLAGVLPELRAPLFVAGGGHDLITPGEEARRVFDEARCERQLVYYSHGAHDCFNVLADLRPRAAGWLARRLAENRTRARGPFDAAAPDALWRAGEAVDPDFADALCGEIERPRWTRAASPGLPVDFAPAWGPQGPARRRVQVVHRLAAAEA
jgi:hypothetical protein